MFDNNSFTQIILPLSMILGGLIIGLIFDKVIMSKIKKLAKKTKWGGDDIFIAALKGIFIYWFLLAGIYFAIHNYPINQSLLEQLKKILLVIFIFSITLVISRATVSLVAFYSRRAEGILPSTSIFIILTRVIVFSLGFLIILHTLGIYITPILTALGVGGLAVALALQDTLSNLFAGLHILVSRQVRVGDYIKLDAGDEGFVNDIGYRNTTVKLLSNNVIVIPNSKLAGSIVTNYYLPEKEAGFNVRVIVNYDNDLLIVENISLEIAKEVIKEVEGGVREFEPAIRFNALSEFGVSFNVTFRVKESINQYLITHEFIKRLHSKFNSEGIKFVSPTLVRNK